MRHLSRLRRVHPLLPAADCLIWTTFALEADIALRSVLVIQIFFRNPPELAILANGALGATPTRRAAHA